MSITKTSDNSPEQELARALSMRTAELARALYRGDISVETVNKLPVQSVYVALQSLGIDGAIQVLDDLPKEKYAIVLDFELWHRDNFKEERFWEWLAVLEEQPSLTSLELFLNALDPALLGVITAKYVHVHYSEEATDPPPGPGYFTPDRGSTWIAFTVEDQRQHSLLAKFYAVIYESDLNLFYQIVLSGTSGTPMEFEEEAYQEKTARLTSVGIPADDISARLNASLPKELVLEALKKANPTPVAMEVGLPVVPLVYEGRAFEPLVSLLEDLSRDAERRVELESELTLLTNAALVYFHVDFSSHQEVVFQVEKIKGSINIALEKAVELAGISAREVYDALGIDALYRFGLQLLRDVKKLISAVPEDIRQKAGEEDVALLVLCTTVLENFPVLPTFFDPDTTPKSQEVLSGGKKAFSLLKEVKAVEELIRSRFHH